MVSRSASRRASRTARTRRCRVLIAGVSGSGKSTVANRLAGLLGWSVLDADRLHTASSIEKMSSGMPLTDEDRVPWLEAVADAIEASSTDLVVACSALRRAYRAYLTDRVPDLQICLLEVSPGVVADRLAHRTGHFMNPSLLATQFATLEPLEDFERGFTVDGDQDVEQVLNDVVVGLEASIPESFSGKGGLSDACFDR